MPVTRRSRFVVLTAGLAGVAMVVALAIGLQPKAGGPELAAPGSGHYVVSAAASANGPVEVATGVFMGADQKHDKSVPLRQVRPDPVRALPAQDEGDGDQGASRSGHVNVADPVVQATLASPAMPGTAKNFDGIPYPGVACNCAPPDTNGEVGATQYVQIVNEGFQVWDKATGSSVYGPAGITTLWSGFGGVCQSAGDGDPVVLYDQLAGRWLVSQFAGSSVPTDECVAISTSSDATGSWYRYDFHLGSNFFDYPKLAVWPDGYYMSDNVFNSLGTSFLGPQPFVFDRARMLQGLSATFQTTAGALGSALDPMLPADVDGSTPPPAGAPESFVMWPGNGAYATYHYHVDWTTPANSTFSLFSSPAAAGFTQLCPTSRACVPESGVSSSSYLDGLADRLMFRLAYRNFGDHESVVGNFTVSSGGVAGVRWFELRNVTAGPETVFQQSTYQPDSTWRWMGSAAMDHNGDIAVGFNASSASIVPQLRYAGRLASDALGTLAQGEATLIAGTGAQSGTSNRWGDYSDLTVDPVDDCTFWFTGEYYSVNASFNWRTRIGSFTMTGCGSSPTTGSIAGQVTDTNTGTGVASASVTITGVGSTTTDASGNYSFSNLAPATYSLTASKTNYTSGSGSGTVTAGNTTTVNLAMTSTTGSLSGKVTDASTSAVIGGATVQISGGGSTTTDASGNYSFPALAGGSYTLTALAAGYATSAATPVSVSNGFNTVQNFSLTPTVFSTSFVFPTSAVAGSGGDGNGYQTAPAGWYAAFDGVVASDSKSGTGSGTSCASTNRDSEVFSGYSLGSLGSSILGIRVQVRGRANSTSSSPSFCVELSTDGGAHWAASKTTPTLGTSLTTYSLGTTSDLWGGSWTPASFGSGFRVRIVDLATSTQRTFYLDGVSVSVTYQ
ncbi:MAG TPA: carboxypeptidase regulatory-like domain-containing protein [Candidatus Limnocylindrales bacterium]|nr:carboxypeptidase regulatory-like domain-containing protein [Candidatus Limnocylindrales bacterium]